MSKIYFDEEFKPRIEWISIEIWWKIPKKYGNFLRTQQMKWRRVAKNAQ